eukprot:scaffold327275_cov18-Prasinocladus_malaysianus.AAC.1
MKLKYQTTKQRAKDCRKQSLRSVRVRAAASLEIRSEQLHFIERVMSIASITGVLEQRPPTTVSTPVWTTPT